MTRFWGFTMSRTVDSDPARRAAVEAWFTAKAKEEGFGETFIVEGFALEPVYILVARGEGIPSPSAPPSTSPPPPPEEPTIDTALIEAEARITAYALARGDIGIAQTRAAYWSGIGSPIYMQYSGGHGATGLCFVIDSPVVNNQFLLRHGFLVNWRYMNSAALGRPIAEEADGWFGGQHYEAVQRFEGGTLTWTPSEGIALHRER